MSINLGVHVRITDPTELKCKEIEEQLSLGKHVIIQFSHPSYYETMLPELNDLCSRSNEKLGVRFFGHYSLSFDGHTLLQIPNVKSLYLDCLVQAHNLEALTQLENLYYLNFDVQELEDTEILNAESFKKLKMLTIFSDKKLLNLAHLRDYSQLHTLIVGGKIKNLDAIGSLSNLELLSLNSVSKTPVHFINQLSKLKTLKFILGGRENIEEIAENAIETLEIVRVRGFNDFRNIVRFKKLRHLLIEDQSQLEQIHFDSEMEHLEEIAILNCKNVSSLSGLDRLSSLRKLRLYKTAIKFNDLLLQKRPDSLNSLFVATGKNRVDNEIKKQLISMGLQKA